MPSFGARSESNLATVDPMLVAVLRNAIRITDFTVLCGHRNQAAQDEYYRMGTSKVQWPNSRHNAYPSQAADVAPWPIRWYDDLAFARLFGVIEGCAFAHGATLTWGGDWDRDGFSRRDQTFMDLGHIQIEKVVPPIIEEVTR